MHERGVFLSSPTASYPAGFYLASQDHYQEWYPSGSNTFSLSMTTTDLLFGSFPSTFGNWRFIISNRLSLSFRLSDFFRRIDRPQRSWLSLRARNFTYPSAIPHLISPHVSPKSDYPYYPWWSDLYRIDPKNMGCVWRCSFHPIARKGSTLQYMCHLHAAFLTWCIVCVLLC